MTNEESIFLDSGLLEEYALDLCTPEERVEVERMLEGSPLIREEYREIQEGLEVLAKSRAAKPPIETKERILAQIEEQAVNVIPMRGESLGGRKSSQLWKVAAGLALLISFGFLMQQLIETRSLRAEIERLKEAQSAQLADSEALSRTIDEMRQDYAFVANPQTEKIILRENQKFDNLQLVAYWNEEEEKTVLDITSMPTPPVGKCFQLWADVHGEMVSVAVISTDKTLLQMGDFQAEAESLNITLENAPGSDHATVSALVTSAAV